MNKNIIWYRQNAEHSGYKGVAFPLVVIIIAVLGILLVFGQQLIPAAIITPACVQPGQLATITTNPIKITQSAPNGNYCSLFGYWNTAGQLKYSIKCEQIGAVTVNQVLPGRTFDIIVPVDAQNQQTTSPAIFVSTHFAAGIFNGGTEDTQLWLGRISEFDEVDFVINTCAPPPDPANPPSSGQRTVFYTLGCTSDFKAIEYCTVENFGAFGTFCATSVNQLCATGTVCQENTVGTTTVAVCALDSNSGTGPLCGQDGDNLCPGFSVTTQSSSICQPYQDSDCCKASGNEWDVLADFFSGTCRTESGEVIATWADAQQEEAVQDIDFVRIFIGSVVLGILTIILVFILGRFIPFLRMFTKPKIALWVLVILIIIYAILFTGTAINAASLIG